MPLPLVAIEYQGESVFSPFTGQRIDLDQDLDKDGSVLFVHLGNVGDFAYVSNRVRVALGERTPEDLTPEELCRAIDISGGLVIEVDAGWNGVNTFAFAPDKHT